MKQAVLLEVTITEKKSEKTHKKVPLRPRLVPMLCVALKLFNCACACKCSCLNSSKLFKDIFIQTTYIPCVIIAVIEVT